MAYRSSIITDHVIELPEDGGRWQLVKVYNDGPKNAEATKVAAWFATTPRLQSLNAQTRSYEYTSSHWWVKNNRPNAPKPLILLMDEKGRRIYEAHSGNMPSSGEQLADEIEKKVQDHCPNVDQQKPVQPWEPVGNPPVLRPDLKDNNLLVVLGLLAASGVAGYYANRSKQ